MIRYKELKTKSFRQLLQGPSELVQKAPVVASAAWAAAQFLAEAELARVPEGQNCRFFIITFIHRIGYLLRAFISHFAQVSGLGKRHVHRYIRLHKNRRQLSSLVVSRRQLRSSKVSLAHRCTAGRNQTRWHKILDFFFDRLQ